MELNLQFDYRPTVPKRGLKVYYGWSKLTPKVMRKPELAVFFENDNHNPMQNQRFIERRMHLVHTRKQTYEESTDSLYTNRMFTKYSYLINEKPYHGDVELALEYNYISDEDHVPFMLREIIRNKLRRTFPDAYPDFKHTPQTSLIFN